jgi:hypothetical protein
MPEDRTKEVAQGDPEMLPPNETWNEKQSHHAIGH